MKNNHKAAEEIRRVASKLQARGNSRAGELLVVANFLDGAYTPGQNFMDSFAAPDYNMEVVGFDPSQETGGGNVNEMAGGKHPVNHHDGRKEEGGEHPGAHHGGGGMHPDIDSFVKPSDNPQMMGSPTDMMDSHTLQCTLKAPEGVSEADMMNYILGIAQALGVKVDSFRWSVQEPKPAAGGGGAR